MFLIDLPLICGFVDGDQRLWIFFVDGVVFDSNGDAVT